MDYDISNSWVCVNSAYEDNNIDISFTFILNDCKVIYNNDGSFNRLRISDEMFVSIYDKKTKEKLKKMIGKRYSIIENGHIVSVGPEFPGEFLYSKSTLSLSKKDKFIKFYILNYLEQMLLYSSGKTWEKNKKKKHEKDSKYGFYKREVTFSIVINNKEKHYLCNLLIRNAYNKKKFLYDDLGIKKID